MADGSCTAAEARSFWLRQEQRGRQPRQLGDRPPQADGACGAGQPHSAGVRVGRAGLRFGLLASQCTDSECGAELAALTAPARQARHAYGVQDAAGRSEAQCADAEQDVSDVLRGAEGCGDAVARAARLRGGSSSSGYEEQDER